MKSRLWSLQSRLAPYLFVAPFLVIFCVFLAYPLTRSLVLSFYKTAGTRRRIFAGLDNYRFLLHDRLFWWALANTLLFTAAFLLIQLPLALGLALLLASRYVRCRNFLRFAIFSTYLVGPVFVSVIFALLLDTRHGLVNRVVGPVRWLADPRLAMVSTVIAALWLSVGYAMIYLLSTLQAVDRQLYEAAAVDGAGPWSRFRYVTLPSIRPVLIFLLVLGTISGFQLFELPYVLFHGAGPRFGAMTVVMYLFMTGFGAGDLGYAAAIGWTLVLLVLAVALFQVRATRALRED